MGHPRLLLLVVAVLTMHFLIGGLEATLCWKRPYCNCYNDERPTIYCRYVRNVSDVVGLFRKHTPVYKILLHGSFTSLPGGAFDGISVSVLSLNAPLYLDIPQDSLRGVRDLRTVILNNTRFERLPDVFSNRDDYGTFQTIRGRLSGLETQLQNMSSAAQIVLRKNCISSVSGDAFLGSVKVQRLDLSYNELSFLHPETFEPMQFLEDVYLEHNHLYTVDGCFRTLNPKTIRLYGNNLTSVDDVFHQGMWNLKSLDLGGNPELRVTSSTFNATLKSLAELHLSNNGIGDLEPSLLRNMWNLRYLYLNGNNLSSIPRYFLEHTPFITTLELSNNRLETADGLLDGVKERRNSMKLTLDGNKLTTAAVGKARISIYYLDLSRNRISDIRAEDMTSSKEAVFLNLSRNDIGFLEEGCFSDFCSLEKLDLSYNPLKNLNGSVQGLPKLYYLYIRSSSLETLTEDEFLGCPRIKFVDLRNNSLSSVYGAFKNMKYIHTLDVSMNNLTTLTADSFPPFQKISIHATVLWMANNSWSCDCRLSWFADWVRRKGSKLMDEPVCSSPDHLQGLTLRTLNKTDFEAWVEDCPGACDCLCRVDGPRMYTEVQCIRKGLKEIPGTLPANARSLDLRGNAIESFDGREVLRLEQLDRLNLENNKIKEVRLDLLPKLSSLRLAYNGLRTFPLEEWVSNATITLSRNPWTCNCDTWTFRNWLIQHNDSIPDLHEVRCGNQESFSLRNKPIISLTRKDLCSYVSSIAIVSVCSVLFLILCLVCLCCRQSLVACLYSYGFTCLKKSHSHDYPYDAFLMYSEADESLALGELAKGLESGKQPFLLCIPARDIPSPRTPQKVDAYLPQCTKVIVLLTRKFIENQECLHLLISAMSFSTENSSKCFIFITQGDLPPTNEMDPALKTLLRSCTCLSWGQCLFWQKLIYQLPKKQSKKEYNFIEEEPLMR